MTNKLTVGVNDCEVELYHTPSGANGAGKNLASALISLGATKEFQRWVSREVSDRLEKGDTANAIANLDPKTLEIAVTW